MLFESFIQFTSFSQPADQTTANTKAQEVHVPDVACNTNLFAKCTSHWIVSGIQCSWAL